MNEEQYRKKFKRVQDEIDKFEKARKDLSESEIKKEAKRIQKEINKLEKVRKKLSNPETPSEPGKFDSVEEIDTPKKEVQDPDQITPQSVPIPRPKPLPTPKEYFTPTQPKSNKFLIIFFGTLIALILITGIICFTITFQKKDFSPSITNNVDVPENPININNEFPENRTIIINVGVDGDLASEIADLVIEKLNQTNST